MPPKTRDEFEIAIICALPLEADAVVALFDEYYDAAGDRYGKLPGDGNTYTTGRIGQHDIVLVHMPGMGKGSAATVASSARMSFVGIKLALVVGICGGVPFAFKNNQQTEIILGDVVISNGVIEYDFGAQYPDGFNRKSDVKDTLERPNRDIRGFLAKLETSRTRKQLELKLSEYVDHDLQHTSANYPGAQQDILYESSYRHKHRNSPGCTCTSNNSSQDLVCPKALQEDCEVLGCGGNFIPRKRLQVKERPKPIVHFGKVASADTVMKSGEHRDTLAKKEDVVAFEMEGAGVWDSLPCVIIKGICDYADCHKNKRWQRYAAMTAASCTKAFLEYWTPRARVQSVLVSNHFISTVPMIRNSGFHGRKEILEKLDEIFGHASDRQGRAALSGLGGVGKTQIALEWAHRNSSSSHILWANGKSIETLQESYLEIAKKAGINLNVTGQGEAVGAVKNWLDSTASGDWRLVIDNVDDQHVESASIRPLLPIRRGAILFIGARTDDIDHLVEESSRIEVPPWTQEEATMMLLKLAGLTKEPGTLDPEAQMRYKNAVDLASRLGCIPLAIAQAAAYIKKNKISIQSYTNELFSSQTSAEVERSKLLTRAIHGPSDLMPQAVMVTWDYSYERLKKHTPAAAKLIQFFSFLSPDGIPFKMLNQSTLQKICDAGPDFSLIEELGHLQSFAMLQMTSASENGGPGSMVITIPALIATWIRDTKIASPDRASMIDIAFRLVAEQFPLANRYTPAAGSHLVSHVRAVQGHRDTIKAEKDTLSKQLDYRMGRHLFYMGQYREAKELLTTHFHYLQETDSDTREQAICGHYVACSLDALDDQATEEWFDRTIELGKALSNTDEFDAWETLTRKAGRAFKKGSLPKSKEILNQVLKARSASLPDGYDESCIFPLKLIAGICQRLDEIEEALEFYSSALDIAEREYGIRNGLTMKLLFGKVEVLKALEDNGKAEECLQKYLLKFFDQKFASNHESSCLSETLEQVFPVLRNLYQYHPQDEIDLKDYIADVYSKEGKHFRALNWHTDAYDQARSSFTDESLYTAFLREHLAMALSKVGDYELAITHLHAVIKVRENNNADEMAILNAQSAEVFFLLDSGDGVRALELGITIYEKYKEICSEEHWETINSLTNLANIYQEIGFPSKALELSQQAMEAFEATDSAEDEDTAFLSKVRGLALADLGKYDETLAALKVSVENYQNDPYESLLVEIEMARVQSKLGNPKTALKSCQDGHKRINEYSDDPAGHPLRWQIFFAEASIYMDLSEPDKALTALRKAENMALAHFNKTHTSMSKIFLAMARAEMALAEKTKPKKKGSAWQESNGHFQRAHDLYAQSAEGFRRSFGKESKYVGEATDGMIISAKHMAELQLQNAQAQGGKFRKAFTYFL